MQKKGKYELSFDELWELIKQDKDSSELINNKEEMLHLVHSLEETNQAIITSQNTIALV